MDKVVQRFINYVKFDTTSNENSSTCPSYAGEKVFALSLVEELKSMGLNVKIDDNGYVYASISANTDGKAKLGFIAHMDTSPDMSGKNVNPVIIENYDGNDIRLNDKYVMSTNEFPDLKGFKGETLIVTDGNTLLGADDKAGIAEIMTAAEYILNHPEIKHGDIKIGFTPDEEIGRGADLFDVKKFDADYAYTVDGGKLGGIEYENFNAAGAKLIIHGKNIHPGDAKNKMINSILIATEINSLLPNDETPAKTEGYEGFYHLTDISGIVDETTLSYIIRDFDKDNFEKRKEKMREIVKSMNDKYGEGTVELILKDQYYNMKEKLSDKMFIVDNAINAMKNVGVKPVISPIRGGTDGARLSYMGLPTPNIFTGGHNAHGRFEYAVVSEMQKAVEVIIEIIKNAEK